MLRSIIRCFSLSESKCSSLALGFIIHTAYEQHKANTDDRATIWNIKHPTFAIRMNTWKILCKHTRTSQFMPFGEHNIFSMYIIHAYIPKYSQFRIGQSPIVYWSKHYWIFKIFHEKNACTSTNVFIVFEGVTRFFTSIPAVFESRHFRLRVFAQRLISRWWPWTWYLGFSTTHCRAHVPQPLGCEPKQGGPESEIWCWVDNMCVGFEGFWFVWSVLVEKAPILYKSGSRQWMIYQSNEWRH